MNRMAETSKSLYNVEEVLNLLEGDPDDDEELDEVFFPGSDDELGLFEDDVDGSDSGSYTYLQLPMNKLITLDVKRGA